MTVLRTAFSVRWPWRNAAVRPRCVKQTDPQKCLRMAECCSDPAPEGGRRKKLTKEIPLCDERPNKKKHRHPQVTCSRTRLIRCGRKIPAIALPMEFGSTTVVPKWPSCLWVVAWPWLYRHFPPTSKVYHPSFCCAGAPDLCVPPRSTTGVLVQGRTRMLEQGRGTLDRQVAAGPIRHVAATRPTYDESTGALRDRNLANRLPRNSQRCAARAMPGGLVPDPGPTSWSR